MILLSLRTVLIAILIVLAPISVTVLGLKASTLNFYSRNIDNDFQLYPSMRYFGVLPYDLQSGPDKFGVAACTISTAVSSAVLAFALLAWPNGVRVRNCPLFI